MGICLRGIKMRRTFFGLMILFCFVPSLVYADDGDIAAALAEMERINAAADEDFTLEDEYYLGRAVAANIMAVYSPYRGNPELTRYVNRICLTLTANSPQPEIYNGYHVIILDSPQFNAFATPGGHILLTRGLVEAAPSEDALAGVIAHELAHIILKHGINIINNMRLIQDLTDAGSRAAGIASRDLGLEDRTVLFGNMVVEMVNAMTVKGYARDQEFAADLAAITLLAGAGYDPNGLIEMLRTLQGLQPRQPGGFNATHPRPEDRIANAGKYTGRYNLQNTRNYRAGRFRNK
jgi:predicted Zn-dependent protease